MPSEQQLERLLREAWEFTPGPEASRLADIESRLLQARRRPAARRRLPWWAILLLAGGAATAAWWAGKIFTEQKRAPERYRVEDRIEGEPSAPANRRTPADAPTTDDGSRIIYERETP
jgi:hypothetical protein